MKPDLPRTGRKAIINALVFDAGGGHRAAARALAEAIAELGLPWELHVFNPVRDVIRAPLGEHLYNRVVLRWGWTWAWLPMRWLLRQRARWGRGHYTTIQSEYFRKHSADLVISFGPLLNRIMQAAYQNVRPGAPYVVALTDLADDPPNFWIEDQGRYHFLCPTAHAEQQALARGHPPERVRRISGVPLAPRFSRRADIDRAAERAKIGLAPDIPTAFVSFSSHGSPALFKVAKTLQRMGDAVQAIIICGHNARLEARVRRLGMAAHVTGYCHQIEHLMQLSDFFIGKPGPGSVSEALSLGLPVITASNRSTLRHERYNCRWLEENGFGIVTPGFDAPHMARALRTLLQPGVLAAYRARVDAHENRGIFELVQHLTRLLAGEQTRAADGEPAEARPSERGLAR